ncbi:MAG TPA: asparagine synthase (glutamine-hydrolyzing) [Chthoniobacterales bacterium]
MCGIAGFFGDFEPTRLAAMNATIAHRGPDDSDVWWDESQRIGFAHRRLSIIDLSSAGRQPMWDTAKRAVIVYNGEIYNYRELARDLRRDGFRFNSATDTEVILNLYLRDGDRCIEQLNGMFAFALWDVEKKRLLVARDGPGVKPLYYFMCGAGFAFASELKALCCLPEMDRQLDFTALTHYLTYLYSPSPKTPLANVHKLEPGCALVLEGKRITRSWRFWTLPVSQPQRSRSLPELEEQLEALLSRAVKRQMIADVPVGAFLSGGLDSSSLVVFARKYAAGRKLDCFTIGFQEGLVEAEGFPDDLPYARQVAEHLDVPLHVIWSGSDMASEFEQMVYQLDEPQPDPAALNVLQIARLSRDKGVKVLLSGAGGDDVFGGYRRHRALSLEKWWWWLPQGTRHLVQQLIELTPHATPIGRRLAKAFQFAGETPDRRMAGYFAWLAPKVVTGLFAPDVRESLMKSDPFEPLLAALRELPSGVEPLSRMLNLEQRFFLPDHNLNYTDKMAMAAGIEVRVPFLDPDLMAFAAALPANCKQHGTVGKWLFKKTMEVHLPHGIIYRRKAGFGAPLREWMRRELREHFDHALSSETIRRRGIFDPIAVESLVQMDRAGRIDAAYPLFGLVCIETWCRLFLDRRFI